jgi:phage tail sheath gpL-like
MSLANIFSLSYLVPGVAAKIDFSRAIRGLRGMPRRLLLIAQRNSDGGAAYNALNKSVGNDADAVALSGEGSMGVAMWRAAKANIDPGVPIDMIFVPEASGATRASATVQVVISGANFPNAGVIPVYIGGVRVSVAVSTADTPAAAVLRLIAAINAVPSLPVTASVGSSANILLLTAKWGGLSGNDIDVRQLYYPDDSLPTGVYCLLTAMTGGAGSPDITLAIAAMAAYRATEIVVPFSDSANMVLLETELEARWAANNMQDGQAISAVRFANSAAALAWLANRNSSQVHTVCTVADASSPWETAAMVGAAIETLAAVDPAVPHVGVDLQGYKGPMASKGWAGTTPNDLLSNGGSFLVGHDDYTAETGRMVTNYTHNGRGAPDRSKSSLNWIKTMSFYRWTCVTEFQIKYYNFKIAEYLTEPIEGQNIMTAQLGQEIMVGLYIDFMKVGLVQNLDYYKGSLVVEVDGPNGKLKIQDEPVLITQHYQTEITSYPIAGHV